MLVIESGFHSSLIRAFQPSLREYCWLRLLENDPVLLTKFSADCSVRVSPSAWFHLTLPLSFSLSLGSWLKFTPSILLAFRPCRPPPKLPPPPPPGNPLSLVLLALPITKTLVWSWNSPAISRSAYRWWVPMAKSLFDRKPLFMPFLMPKSSTVCSSPSSMPVTLAKSLFSSYALILSMIEVGRFFRAVLVSPVINSLPSTSIFFTSLPLTVILPSSSTLAPGRRFTSSSTTEPSGVL